MPLVGLKIAQKFSQFFHQFARAEMNLVYYLSKYPAGSLNFCVGRESRGHNLILIVYNLG